MAAAAEAIRNNEDSALAELRLLTEVSHFLADMDADGDVPEGVFKAVAQNRETAVSEIAMPYAVTTTEHEVVERENQAGRRERVIMWLGQTALEVAASGYDYHFSAAARRRIPVEEAEAMYAQENLQAGIAQVFVSPRMTRYDASEAVAKAEHLHADDAIRVSAAITDSHGNVIRRRLQSVLVRDVPFDAWITMLQDPGNIFGKALPLRDEHSAVSVMELFGQMELPENALPEGPVTLVAAVLPYIRDDLARQRVKRQLARFRGDQTFYTDEAKTAGADWARFDLELARSIQQGEVTDDIQFFIMQNTDAWNDESLQILREHQRDDARFRMTRQLAALLSRAKEKRLGDELSAVTNNDIALKDVPQEAVEQIRANYEQRMAAVATNAAPAYIRQLERQQYRLLQNYQIRSGGGCQGEAENAFDDAAQQVDVGEKSNPFTSEAKSSWQWKQGVCRVKVCPSPKPTEVGPCSVCRRCQHEFDVGRDPTKRTLVRPTTAKTLGVTSISEWLARKESPQSVPATANFLTAA